MAYGRFSLGLYGKYGPSLRYRACPRSASHCSVSLDVDVDVAMNNPG
ncbi:MAG: hypothetical protein AB7P03_04905 [Kofleriaceae bacterium]